VDHLVELGHERIAHISSGEGAAGPERRRGYEDRMRHHGLDRLITTVAGAFTLDGGKTGMRALLALDPRPTAVLAPNDFAAIGALDVAVDAGIDVPGQISVTGYDNIALGQIGLIRLTTIAQPAAQLGRVAVGLLRERVEDRRTDARHIVLPPALVVGSTTGPPPD
jgi:DNA-binding LacI/PurR family transcriptional regulator